MLRELFALVPLRGCFSTVPAPFVSIAGWDGRGRPSSIKAWRLARAGWLPVRPLGLLVGRWLVPSIGRE
jgi:hypothetical protein